MSFTAQVKDELSRVDPPTQEEALSELSAMVRICGTLSFHGNGRYTLRVQTETGSVARSLMQLIHNTLGLETALTVRRSVQRKSNNYLIEIADQDQLGDDLERLGIIAPGRGLTQGVPSQLIRTDDQRRAFLRGAFLAGGFVADPRGDFHLEICVTGDTFAQGIQEIASTLGASARLNHRRGAFAVYLKSYDDVKVLLEQMGATRSAASVESVRELKSVKSAVNRQVNAELANERRASRSGADQIHLIRRVQNEVGIARLPVALQEFCELRLRYPEMSLSDLGQLCNPCASKSAMYHRVLRLQKIVSELDEKRSGAMISKNQ